MRVLKISRKGEFKPDQDKATAICVGGHGGGASNNSQSDIIVYLYEADRNLFAP